MRGSVLIACFLISVAAYATAFACGRATAPPCPSIATPAGAAP